MEHLRVGTVISAKFLLCSTSLKELLTYSHLPAPIVICWVWIYWSSSDHRIWDTFGWPPLFQASAHLSIDIKGNDIKGNENSNNSWLFFCRQEKEDQSGAVVNRLLHPLRLGSRIVTEKGIEDLQKDLVGTLGSLLQGEQRQLQPVIDHLLIDLRVIGPPLKSPLEMRLGGQTEIELARHHHLLKVCILWFRENFIPHNSTNHHWIWSNQFPLDLDLWTLSFMYVYNSKNVAQAGYD